MSQADQPAPDSGDNDDIRDEKVQMSHVSARVPEHVSRGVFSTGMIVITGPTEFILDFIQNIGRPHQVVARLIMPHSALPQLAEALRKNLELYRQRFGDPPALPKVEPRKRPTIQEVYDDLKMPEDVIAGSYANGVMISHTASEFGLDFLANFFPKSAVSCRIFISAAQAPRILDSLDNTFKQFQEKVRRQQEESQRKRREDKPPGGSEDAGDGPDP